MRRARLDWGGAREAPGTSLKQEFTPQRGPPDISLMRCLPCLTLAPAAHHQAAWDSAWSPSSLDITDTVYFSLLAHDTIVQQESQGTGEFCCLQG